MSQQLGKFGGALDVRLLNAAANSGRGRWQLLAPLSFASVVAGKIFTVPAGFVTDFMSVPDDVPGVVSLSRSRRAGTVHDWLYTKQPDGSHPVADRETADQVLREMFLSDLIDAGARDDAALSLEADAVFAGVRLGGAAHWG